MEKVIVEEGNEVTIMHTMVRLNCKQCGTRTLHEHGNIIRNGQILRKMWVCIKCGLVTTEKT